MLNLIRSIVILLIGLAAFAGGGYAIARQDLELHRRQPVPGEKISAAGKTPLKYGYTFNGIRHTSTQITPPYGDADADWKSFYAKKPQGEPLTVYVDRADPQNAVLVRETMTYPYWIALLGIGFAALGATLWSGGLDDGPQFARPAGDPHNGAIELHVKKQLRPFLRGKLAGALLLAPAALFIAAYYLVRATPYDWRGCFLVAVCITAITWQLFRVRGPWKMARAISDPRLWIPAGPIRRGEKFSVNIEVKALRPLSHLSVFIELACVNHFLASLGPGNWYEKTVDLWISEHAHIYQSHINPGDLIRGTAEFLPPTNQAESNGSLRSKDKDGWPYCIWELRVSFWTGSINQTQAFVVNVR